MISALVGLFVTLVLIFGAIAVGGGSAQGFVHFPSLIIVTGIAVGLSLVSCGVRDLWRALSSLSVLVSAPPDSIPLRRSAKVLRCLISYLYAGGALGALIGFIQMARNLPELKVLPIGLSVIAVTLLYPVFLSECFLRPAAHKIESATKDRVRNKFPNLGSKCASDLFGFD